MGCTERCSLRINLRAHFRILARPQRDQVSAEIFDLFFPSQPSFTYIQGGLPENKVATSDNM